MTKEIVTERDKLVFSWSTIRTGTFGNARAATFKEALSPLPTDFVYPQKPLPTTGQ